MGEAPLGAWDFTLGVVARTDNDRSRTENEWRQTPHAKL
jgi:hypothetical protein